MLTPMRWIANLSVLAVLACLTGCGGPEPVPQPGAESKPAAPAIPEEVEAAAQAILGSEAEVLLHGDLARTGAVQVLSINRIKKAPEGAPPGTLFTRLAIVEKAGDKWREVLRCDEHLKNPNGFLAATPISPVNGWRLQQEKHSEQGLVLYFTPLQKPAGGSQMTIGVRWNPKLKRYQSLDRGYQTFLGETPMLEKVGFDFRGR